MRQFLPLLLAATLAAPLTAQAQTRVIAQANGWSALDGMAEGGAPLCVLETRDPNTGRHFLLQQVAGQDRPVLRLSRPNWSLRGATQPVRIVIDNRRSFADGATVSGQELIWPLALDGRDGFEFAFRQGRYMRVEFPGGADSAWNLSLTGTNNVMGAFVGCLRMLVVQPGAVPPPIQPTPPSEPPPLGPQPGEPPRPPAEPLRPPVQALPPAGAPRYGIPADKPGAATPDGGKTPGGKPGAGGPVPL